MKSTLNPWMLKAKALDRYRWALLRQRHGRVGSGLRFLRDAIKDSVFGGLARFRLNHDHEALTCDFLLLQSARKVIRLQRKKLLINALQEGGHRLIETALDAPRKLLEQRCFCRPGDSVPLRYFGYAAHAQWLVEHYKPRIVLNDRNGSLFAPFLKLALESVDAKLVHLAHATTLDSSARLSMNDYHYYFLFGRSSLDALRKRKLLFGTSVAVVAGSHMVDESYRLARPDPACKTLLILGVGPDKEKLDSYLQTYALLRAWASANAEYRVLIKGHPRSSMVFWNTPPKPLNLQILPADVTLADALAEASIVINILSNAIIEAGLSGRPIIQVNYADSQDMFGESHFFGPVIRDINALSHAIKAIEKDYALHCKQSIDFAEYHLEQGVEGLKNNIEALKDILKGNLPKMPYETLTESWP